MLRQKLFIEQFVLIAIIAILHYLALKFYFYWTLEWFDIFMHFLGGLWVVLFFVWFLFFSKFIKIDIKKHQNRKIFFVSILAVLVVGLLWEVFEVFASFVSVQERGYALDTSLDLMMDLIGGVLAFLYIKRKYLNYERK